MTNQLLPFLWKSNLKDGARNEVLLKEGFGRHVVHDGGGEVGQDAVHCVPRLLSGDEDHEHDHEDIGDDDDLVLLKVLTNTW